MRQYFKVFKVRTFAEPESAHEEFFFFNDSNGADVARAAEAARAAHARMSSQYRARISIYEPIAQVKARTIGVFV